MLTLTPVNVKNVRASVLPTLNNLIAEIDSEDARPLSATDGHPERLKYRSVCYCPTRAPLAGVEEILSLGLILAVMLKTEYMFNA